jgi:small conductance mechanosensitive channel
MDPITTPAENPVSEMIQATTKVIEQASEYGFVIFNSLFLIIGGLFVIFLLHKLASRFIYPYLGSGRLIKVSFGTIYVLIFVVMVLLALKTNGHDVSGIAQIALLGIIIGGVATYFLMPFLPRLPFKLGHMVEIDGVHGMVDTISPSHTTIRKSDGTMVFIPNAQILMSKIMNYHDTPTRRIEMKVSVKADSDIEEVRSILLRLMDTDERVQNSPSPPGVIVINANALGVEMAAFCWVKNADWSSTRSDLWRNVANAFNKDSRVTMSLPQQEVFLIDGNKVTNNIGKVPCQ